ncbi:MAG TPA: hypothetical protein VMG12_12935 [Polyangiaceae bacterium]|nr:hypothetical protein [Polyangiaceae bacterium]
MLFPTVRGHLPRRADVPSDGVPERRNPGGPVPSSPGYRTPAHPSWKRAGRALIALCGGATILIGCPLYSDECDSQSDCASGFYCDQFSLRCEAVLDAIGCVRPNQCEVGETCTPDFVCRPGSCDYHGCVRGYRCGVVDFIHTCIPVGSADAGPGGDDASSPSSGAGGSGGGDALDAGADAGDAGVDASL